MPLELRTVLNRTEIDAEGTVSLRLGKQIVDTDTGKVIGEPSWHRAVISPGMDPVKVIAAVNTDMETNLGFPPIGSEDADKITGVVAFVQKPEVVAAYKAKVKAAEDALKAADSPQ